MRRCLLGALALLAWPAAAHAQVQSVPWALEQPTSADFREVYPATALEQGLEGVVRLLCTITDAQKLDCEVLSETHPGAGFAEAALSLSHRYVVRRQEDDARLVPGRRVIVPIEFRLMD